MRPTDRALLVMAAGIPASLVLVLIDGAFWPFGLAWLAITFFAMAFDAVVVPSPRHVEVNISPPNILYVGDSDDALITLTASSGSMASQAEILVETTDNLRTQPPNSAALIPRQQSQATFVMTPLRRGTGQIKAIWLRWPGPLGLIHRWRRDDLTFSVPIVPNVRAVSRAALQFQHRVPQVGDKAQSDPGPGSEFDAMREYVPGIDLRSIDWKHSARHQKLVCKEFRSERDHQIILAMDCGHLMSEPIEDLPRLDRAINAALMLSYFALRDGDRVGMISFDTRVRSFLKPVAGVAGFTQLQRATADLAYRAEETNFTLGMAELMGRLDRRSLIIMITEFVDTITAELMVENVARLSRKHLVVFVTLRDPSLDQMVDAAPRDIDRVARSVVAEEFIRERDVVFEQLRQHGIQTLDLTGKELDMGLLSRYIAIRDRELV